jgi:hypothetical protein
VSLFQFSETGNTLLSYRRTRIPCCHGFIETEGWKAVTTLSLAQSEAGHSLSSSSEVKNAWSSTSTPPFVFMAWCLVKCTIRLHGRWATGWTIGSRVRFPAGDGNFSLHRVQNGSAPPLQPPIQWVPGALSLGVKRPGRKADHSPTPNAEVKECVELYLHSPSTHSWRGD